MEVWSKKWKPVPKIGLALSGGSTWGMAHVGVLKALEESGIEIHCIAGTSAGALAAAFFAFGVPAKKMADVSKKLDWKMFRSFAFSRFGLSTNKIMEEFIRKELGNVRIEDAKIPLAIIATNIESGMKEAFRKGNVAEAVRASTSIPGVFTPVLIGDTYYVDGGIAERLPLSPLKDMGADITIGVHLSSRLTPKKPRDVRDILMRSISILSRARDSFATGLADVLIEPDMSRFDSTDFGDTDLLQKEGFRAAMEKIPEIRRKIKEFQSPFRRLWRSISS